MSSLTVIHFIHICKIMLRDVKEVASEPNYDKALTETVRLKMNANCLGRLSNSLNLFLSVMIDNFVIFIATPTAPFFTAEMTASIGDILHILNGPTICRHGGLVRLLLRYHIQLSNKPMILAFIKPILKVLIDLTALPEGTMVNYSSYAIMQVMS